MFGAGALEDSSYLQEEMFLGAGADELKAHGKARGSETAGNGDCGNAREIGGAVGAEEQGPGGVILAAEVDGFLTDKWGGDRCGWNG